MIVVCPQCETRFDIPEDKYRPGRKARCSNCGNVFPLPELSAPGGDALPEDVFASFDADIRTPLPEETRAENTAMEPAAGPEEAPDASLDSAEDSLASPVSSVSVDDVVFDPNEEKPAKRSRKNLVIILGSVVLLGLLCAGGFFLYTTLAPSDPAPFAPQTAGPRTSLSLDGKGSGADGAEDAARQAAVRRLALEKVRQYTVTDNEKAGRMIVVEGSVVNNFDTPKDLILLEVTLYDEKGTALVLREQYCGVTLSLMQLTSMPKAALENALNDQRNILLNNMGIPPGGSVPFMTVFFNLPSSAYEFEVKIVDVKDPAPVK